MPFIATAYAGVKRVWPEMPDDVAAEADRKMAANDIEGALIAIRDWEMTIRAGLTRRWAQVCDERDALK
ncbi:MAG: hypothetical protein EOO27_06380 [Comamonadaceae bacterium]|nr:MAG: hypothetical protein EOO27_06380 [Comamonadaceae bacterium]